jgi:hypothetical protein
VILRELRTEGADGRRIGLVMLIAPMGKVTLQVQGPHAIGRDAARCVTYTTHQPIHRGYGGSTSTHRAPTTVAE